MLRDDLRILGMRFAEGGLRVVLILLLALVAIHLIQKLTGRLDKLLTIGHSENAEIQKRANTLAAFVRYFLMFLITAIGTMMVLKEIGVEIGPILASAGVVGLAVGFGAQNLVQDIISGFFILLEDQIRVGDVVNIKGKGGLVEKVGLRMIILRDLDGSVHFIRNGQIDIVSNMTKQFANYVLDLRIPYGHDPEQVTEILRAVDDEMRKDPKFGPDILKPIDLYGVEQYAESWMLVRGRTTTKPLRQWDVGREFMRRIKLRLDAAGIPLAGQRVQIVTDQKKLRAGDQVEVTEPEGPGDEPNRPKPQEDSR
jgi:moderate conductance mechanosensitive channel